MSVVIIGGGLAGTAAASVLTSHNIDVTLIEAENRLGGRTRSIEVDNEVIDLGASWLHETLVNPLFDIALKNKITLAYDDGVFRYFDKNGVIEDKTQAHRIASEVFAALSLLREQPPSVDMSLKDFTIEFLQARPFLTENMRRLTAHYIQFVEHWLGVNWSKQSARNSYFPNLGRDAYVLDGTSSVYKAVHDTVDWDRVDVQLNERVERITQGQNEQLHLTLASGIEIDAQYVICTIPLGVLAKTHRQLLQLPISTSLRYEIDFGFMGALGKVYMKFPERFWDPDLDRCEVIKEIERTTRDHPLDIVPGEHPVFFTFAPKYAGHQTSLVALVAPPLTQLLESESDRGRCFEFLLPALDAMRVDKTRPVSRPTLAVFTDWTCNPNFEGSYSGYGPGQSEERIDRFIKGEGPLRFAGEHTIHEGAQCMHGAYMSGLREGNIVSRQIANQTIKHKL